MVRATKNSDLAVLPDPHSQLPDSMSSEQVLPAALWRLGPSMTFRFIAVWLGMPLAFPELLKKNALIYELEDNGLKCEKEKPVTIFYKGRPAGNYRADIIVEGKVILEIKVANEICKAHEFQLVNYLRGTGIPDGLIINFGSFPMGFKRKFLNSKQSNGTK